MYRANLKMSIRYSLSSNPSLLIFLVRSRSSLKSMKKHMSPMFHHECLGSRQTGRVSGLLSFHLMEEFLRSTFFLVMN